MATGAPGAGSGRTGEGDAGAAEEARRWGRRRAVIDTHIHLAVGWKEGQGGLSNAWLRGNSEGKEEGQGFNREWSEEAYRRSFAGSPLVDVSQAIFVECFGRPATAEARWVLGMVNDPASIVVGVVAHLPVKEGAAAVEACLADFRGADGALPAGLKGARQVFLGDPMPAADACLDPTFLDGLHALAASGLHWEFCCQPCALPHVATVCGKFPGMQFVLDHMGHNAGGEDLDTWSAAIREVAGHGNVVCKLGAIEEWEVADPLPYLRCALEAFGVDRVLYESNWFVSEAFGDSYDKTFSHVLQALESLGWDSEEHLDKVFSANARRVYRLN